MTQDRKDALEQIKRNIKRDGFHSYLVEQGMCPRFSYTIGLSGPLGFELILAGAICYDADEVRRILHSIQKLLNDGADRNFGLAIDGLGSFTLRRVHGSWAKSLLLGASDYYQSSEIDAYQVVPDPDHWTIDVPNLSVPWSAAGEPIWQWLHEPWQYDVPSASHAATNLDALRGRRITEATRWEADYWEMFSGSGQDVPSDQARVVPLGCLLAADPSLRPVVDLEIGKALRRGPDGDDWNPWGSD